MGRQWWHHVASMSGFEEVFRQCSSCFTVWQDSNQMLTRFHKISRTHFWLVDVSSICDQYPISDKNPCSDVLNKTNDWST